MITFNKQPADIQDYDINWNQWLTGMSDTAVSYTIVSDPGIAILSSTLSAGVIKVWISGGVDGGSYIVTLTLTTAGGRVKQHEFAINIRNN